MLEFPSETEALLFDCDGTLANTMPLHHAAWNQTLKPYGIDCPPAFIDTHAGKSALQVAELAALHWSVELDPNKVMQDKEALFEKVLHQADPIDIVLETARGYFGKLKMGVVSGGLRHLVEMTLQQIGAYEMFPVIVTANDPVPPKPSPEIFLEAARRLDVEPTKCHVFEDGDSGIVAAKAAGMTCTDVREFLAPGTS
jgi:HAD superfamily hydrolase (TIGR01509 family)